MAQGVRELALSLCQRLIRACGLAGALLGCASYDPGPDLVLKQTFEFGQPSEFEVVANPGELAVGEVLFLLDQIHRAGQDLRCTRNVAISSPDLDRPVVVSINGADRC